MAGIVRALNQLFQHGKPDEIRMALLYAAIGGFGSWLVMRRLTTTNWRDVVEFGKDLGKDLLQIAIALAIAGIIALGVASGGSNCRYDDCTDSE
jgi:H+/Cl- antiporter ClcA